MTDPHQDAVRDQLVEEALVAMVYVHPCNCGDGIPQGACARCRAVEVLGFDPAVLPAETEPAPNPVRVTLLRRGDDDSQPVVMSVWLAGKGSTFMLTPGWTDTSHGPVRWEPGEYLLMQDDALVHTYRIGKGRNPKVYVDVHAPEPPVTIMWGEQ